MRKGCFYYIDITYQDMPNKKGYHHLAKRVAYERQTFREEADVKQTA